MSGRSARLFIVVAAGMVVLFGVVAATALGSFSGASVSGEITKAEANETWMSASIAGSAQWGECPEGPVVEPFLEGEVIVWDPSAWCSWTPYATIAQGSDPAECDDPDRHLNQLGNDVFLSWQGVIRTAADSQSFDIPDSPMDGAAGQLLCLSMWETVYEPVFCVDGSEAPAAHSQSGTRLIEGGECPEYLPVSYYYTLDATPLQSTQSSGNSGAGGSKSQTPNVSADAPPPPRSVAVPWGISSILGRHSLMLSWTAKYCPGKGSPEPEHVAVDWLPRGHGRFRARITVYVSYPPDAVQPAGCDDLARVSMSQRVRLRHPLLRSVLLDGGTSPVRQRWPG